MYVNYTGRGRDSSYVLARLSAASVLYGEAETLNDTSRAQVCSSSHQLLEKYFSETRELKVAFVSMNLSAYLTFYTM